MYVFGQVVLEIASGIFISRARYFNSTSFIMYLCILAQSTGNTVPYHPLMIG